MSSSRYSLDLVWTSHGEALRADLDRNINGLLGFENKLNSSSRKMGAWGQQMKATGTMIRYALAGAVVFGVTSAINSLSDFENKLGQLDAVAGRLDSKGNLVGLGGTLEDLGTDALKMSNKFGVAVGEVETYMQRFYTAFRPTGSKQENIAEMRKFVEAHLELVTMLGSRSGDPNQLAGGLAALAKNMPGGDKKPGEAAETLSNYFAKIVTSSPNLSGQDIANAAGRLASAKTLSHMSMRDVLSAFGLAAQTGGSPAVIIRGMTQLLGQSLMHPTKKESKAVYKQAGLPTDPNMLAQLGGEHVLERLIGFVSEAPAGQKRKMNLDAVYNAFGRQESVRQFVNLLANGGVPALKAFQGSLDQAAKDNLAHQAAKRVLDKSELMIASNAQKNLNLSLVRGFNPVFNLLGKFDKRASDAVINHPDATTATIAGVASAAVASRIITGKGLFGLAGAALKRIPRFARAGGAAGALEGPGNLAAATLVGSGLGALTSTGKGTRSDPMWTVIDPISWFMPGAPSGSGMGGGGSGDPKSTGGKALRIVKKYPFLPAGAAALALGAGYVTIAGQGPEMKAEHSGFRSDLDSFAAKAGGYPRLHSLLVRYSRAGGHMGKFNDIQRKAISEAGYDMSKANAMLVSYSRAAAQGAPFMGWAGAARHGTAGVNVEGQAIVKMVLESTDELKKLFKLAEPEKHVKMSLSDSGGSRPQHRGKNKSIRGSGTR